MFFNKLLCSDVLTSQRESDILTNERTQSGEFSLEVILFFYDLYLLKSSLRDMKAAPLRFMIRPHLFLTVLIIHIRHEGTVHPVYETGAPMQLPAQRRAQTPPQLIGKQTRRLPDTGALLSFIAVFYRPPLKCLYSRWKSHLLLVLEVCVREGPKTGKYS